jgi:DNA mismatch repair protein MutL
MKGTAESNVPDNRVIPTGRIRVLPDHMVNLIAAGEVVERPVSIVREFLDNAIDAGATEVLVEIEEGGLTVVRVTDNGIGMSEGDLIRAFERHATSKIQSPEDLDQITTRGFRGEALASIAAVSKVFIQTREQGAPIGTQLRIEGGRYSDPERSTGTVGTVIESRSLFFNTPARRKFLRMPRTEEQRVKDWVIATALANPAIHLRLRCDGREVLNLPAKPTLTERASSLIKGTSLPLNRVTHGEDGRPIQVTGVIGHPGLAQIENKALTLIVNGRVISDRILLRAVKEGFAGMLKDREVPLGVVRIDLDPRAVDVNVHPQKSEVRFLAPQELFRAVQSAVRSAVEGFRGATGAITAPSMTGSFRPFEMKTAPHYPAPGSVRELGPSYSPSEQNQASLELYGPNIPQSAGRSSENSPSLSAARYIGQAFACYLFAELNGELFVVDMHAAHERINYNRIRALLDEAPPGAQQLLVPISVQLTERGVARVSEEDSMLRRLGIEFESFGADAIVVRGVPSFFPASAVAEFIRQVAGSEEGEASGIREDRLTAVAARLACHASIRSGQILSREEAEQVFRELDRALTGAACPHGRPVLTRFASSDIERWFGRDR